MSKKNKNQYYVVYGEAIKPTLYEDRKAALSESVGKKRTRIRAFEEIDDAKDFLFSLEREENNNPCKFRQKTVYYAVAKGRVPGIYTSPEEAQAQVKSYSGFKMKSFTDRTLAETYIRKNAKGFGEEEQSGKDLHGIISAPCSSEGAFKDYERYDEVIKECVADKTNSEVSVAEVLIAPKNKSKSNPKAPKETKKKAVQRETDSQIDNTLNRLKQGEALAFIDGSYKVISGVSYCGYGVIIKTNKASYKLSDAILMSFEEDDFDNSTFAEIISAMKAMEWAEKNSFSRLIVYHDCKAIQDFILSKSSNKLASEYKAFIQGLKVKVQFVKIKGHIGVKYHTEADRLASAAISKVNAKKSTCYELTAENLKLTDVFFRGFFDRKRLIVADSLGNLYKIPIAEIKYFEPIGAIQRDEDMMQFDVLTEDIFLKKAIFIGCSQTRLHFMDVYGNMVKIQKDLLKGIRLTETPMLKRREALVDSE